MIQGIAISPFDAAAILIVLAAILSYLNHRFIGLPASIGLTVMGAISSLIVVAADWLLIWRSDQIARRTAPAAG